MNSMLVKLQQEAIAPQQGGQRIRFIDESVLGTPLCY